MSDTHDFDKDIMNSFLKDSYKIFINMREHFKENPDKAYDYFNLYLNDFDKFEKYIESDDLDICKDILKSSNQDIYKVINNKDYYSFVAVFSKIFKLQFNYEWNVEQNYRVIQNYFNDDTQKNKSPYSFILYHILETNGYFGTSDNTNNNGFIQMIKINDRCNKYEELKTDKAVIYNILFNQIVDSYYTTPNEMNFLLKDLIDDKNTNINNIITHYMLLKYDQITEGVPKNNDEKQKYISDHINTLIDKNMNTSTLNDDNIKPPKFIIYILLLSILFNVNIKYTIDGNTIQTNDFILLDEEATDYEIDNIHNFEISENININSNNNSNKVIPDNTYFYLNFNYFENIIENNKGKVFKDTISERYNKLFYDYNNLYLNNVFYELFEKLIKDNVIPSFDYETTDLTNIFEDKIITKNDISNQGNMYNKIFTEYNEDPSTGGVSESKSNSIFIKKEIKLIPLESLNNNNIRLNCDPESDPEMKNIINNIINIDRLCNKTKFEYEPIHRCISKNSIYSIGKFYKDIPSLVKQLNLFHELTGATIASGTTIGVFFLILKIGLISGIFSFMGLISIIPILAYISVKKFRSYLKKKEPYDAFLEQKPETVYKFTYFYNNIEYLPYIYKPLYTNIDDTLKTDSIREAIFSNHPKLTSIIDNKATSYEVLFSLFKLLCPENFIEQHEEQQERDVNKITDLSYLRNTELKCYTLLNLILNYKNENYNGELFKKCLDYYNDFIKRQAIEQLISSSFLINLILDNQSYEELKILFLDTKEKYYINNDIDYITLIRNFIYNNKNSHNNYGDLFETINYSYKLIPKHELRGKIKIVINKIEENEDIVLQSEEISKLREDKNFISRKSRKGFVNFIDVYNINYEDDFFKVSEKLLLIHEELIEHTHSIIIQNLVPIVFFIIYREIYNEVNFEERFKLMINK